MHRPNLSFNEVQNYVPNNVREKVLLVGLRGYQYYPGNRVGEYDDAVFVVGPNVFESFNFNTDPSRLKKDVAILKSGTYYYRQGDHQGSWYEPYRALRLANEGERVPVERYGRDCGDCIGTYIHIHHGNPNGSTSSIGCQTVPYEQWEEFIELVYSQMDKYRQREIPYVLHVYRH